MNKKLVALAVAGALGAPVIASAQAGSVVLYGTVRGGLTSTKFSSYTNAAGANVASVSSIEEASYSSRFGIRANETFGGLTGFAHLEVGYNADQLGATNDTQGNRLYVNNGTGAATAIVSNAAGNFQIRESWVGLSGGFGEIKFGSGLSVYDDVMGMNHNSIVGGYNNINAFWFGNGFANYNACIGTAFDSRYANSVRYASPKLGPVQYRGQYAIGNEASTGRKCSAFDSALMAGFGPIQAAVGYVLHNNFAAGLAPNANSTGSSRLGDHDAKLFIGVLKGSFGVVDANIGYETAKYESNHTATSGKYNAYVLGAGVNFGPTKVGIDYSARNNSIGATSTTVTQNVLGGGKLATLYVNHNFSKRTIGYVWFSRNNPEGFNPKSTQIAFNLRHNY